MDSDTHKKEAFRLRPLAGNTKLFGQTGSVLSPPNVFLGGSLTPMQPGRRSVGEAGQAGARAGRAVAGGAVLVDGLGGGGGDAEEGEQVAQLLGGEVPLVVPVRLEGKERPGQ